MANCVDTKINEIINEHVAESEKASVSRNVDETARRIKEALNDFSRLDVLASSHWEGLYYEAKIMALRDAVLEMAAKSVKADPASTRTPGTMTHTIAITDPGHTSTITLPDEPAPKKGRKAKAAA